jgi:hypothetical protein
MADENWIPVPDWNLARYFRPNLAGLRSFRDWS